jgi:hypothetical protein
MSRSFIAALTMLAFAGALPAAAGAEIEPGNIPAETIQTAYPIQPGVTVDGTFKVDTATYHDLDYLAVTVAAAGETLEFTLQNTTQGINPATCDEWCPVYLSILNQSNTLVGDGAGTVATYGDTEVLDWTFQTTGTYYLVMESDGDQPLSYATSYEILSGSSGGGGDQGSPPSAPLVRSLHVSGHQRGDAVRAKLRLGQPASVRARLLNAHGKTVKVFKQSSLGAGTHSITLKLPAVYRRALARLHRIKLKLAFSVSGASATAGYTRSVTLSL